MNRKGYPSDLTDAEWEIIKEIMEPELPYTTGRPVQVDYREIMECHFLYGPDRVPVALSVQGFSAGHDSELPLPQMDAARSVSKSQWYVEETGARERRKERGAECGDHQQFPEQA